MIAIAVTAAGRPIISGDGETGKQSGRAASAAATGGVDTGVICKVNAPAPD